MGNRNGVCGGSAAQQCVDECTRVQFELEGRSRDAEEPECDPAGAVFTETLEGLTPLEQEALRFAGTSNLSAIRWLMAMGTSLTAKDRNNTTMLHAACRSGSCSIVQELLQRGLPPDLPDAAGWTALHIAAMMGRCEVSLLLLRGRANAVLKNNRGKTPLALCSDPATKQVLVELGGELGMARLQGSPSGLDMPVGSWNQFSTRGAHEDNMPTCEPFFVPRVPVFRDDPECHGELVHIGMDMFRQSAGHGLAFIVASGIVHDHPTDLSAFLLRHKADPAQLGEFLGEDFSLAQTLRLAFIHSEDLSGTGVVSALMKAFQHILAPPDLRKVDRLTSGIAHLWWRTHTTSDDQWDDTGDAEHDDGSLEWSLFVQDPTGSAGELPPMEASGHKLRNSIQSVEVLRRLMFSTVMLCWNLFAPKGALPFTAKQQPLSMPAWLDMNMGLEADGSNVPMHVLRAIYLHLADSKTREMAAQLLPKCAGNGEKGGQDVSGLPSPSPRTLDLMAKEKAIGTVDVQSHVKGWALIPRGGLERREGAAIGLSGGGIKHCIMSETSSASIHQPSVLPQIPAGQQTEEVNVFLSLRFGLVLFLSSGPTDPPYAFLRMKDVFVRDVDSETRSLVLAGKEKIQDHLGKEKAASESPEPKKSWIPPVGGSPFPDNTRQPLPLCFLLADGRFQPFEALWLELQFKSEQDFDVWSCEMSDGAEVSVPRPRTAPAARRAFPNGATRAGQGRLLSPRVPVPPASDLDNFVDTSSPNFPATRGRGPSLRHHRAAPPSIADIEGFTKKAPRPAG